MLFPMLDSNVDLLLSFIILVTVLGAAVDLYYDIKKNDATAEEWRYNSYKCMAAVLSVLIAVIAVIVLPAMTAMFIMWLVIAPFETVVIFEVLFLIFTSCDINDVFDFSLLEED